jgi:uncharacterized sulfatase
MSNQPNFVIIFGETQGANVIGVYGNQGVQTPNIDRFASESTLFRRGYTTCPLCTPSRAGMFSGIYFTHLADGRTIYHLGTIL